MCEKQNGVVRTAGCALQIRITDYASRLTYYGLPLTDYGLHASLMERG